MNWYSNLKTADAQWNWDTFNRTLLQTIGVGGAVMALMIYFNVDKQHAERMVAEQPQEVEQQLQQIPKQELLKLKESSPSQPLPSTSPQQTSVQPPAEPPQPIISQPSSSLNENDIKQQIISHEGKEHMAYKDTTGNMTVGIGFNLERPDAKQILRSMGLDYSAVYHKRVALNDAQIDHLFNITFNEAKEIAHGCIQDLDSHPQNVQKVVIDMAFNLGPNISTFTNFIQNIDKRDYRGAAKEMVNSRWYGQVKQRSRDLVRMMNEAANPQ